MGVVKCAECLHWQAVPGMSNKVGVCRRYAPRPVNGDATVVGMKVAAIWPAVNAEAWCGEWEEKPAMGNGLG